MNKPGKSTSTKASLRVSLLTALLTSAFGVAGVSDAQAAGLGKLTVYSAIGQPLNAEVALTATPEEMSALSAKLASHDDFKKAGIEFMSALSGLRLSVAKQPDGQPVLKLTTERPLNEPFLHFLVELNWTAGRLVREYTFLLDPPEMLQAARPASVVTPVVPPVFPQAVPVPTVPAKAQAEPRPVRSADAAPAVVAKSAKPKPRAVPASEPSVVMPSTGGRQVKSGDTLSKIALENKPATVGLDQMLVALFNSNREAFDGNNMNRLRAGRILRLPDPGEVAGVDAGEARKLIVAQTADFNAYRRSLAGAAALAPATETPPQQRAAGKIKPQVESKAPPVAAKDKLEVSPTEAAKFAGAAKASGAASKAALEEDLIARDKALREASGRIAELEKNLENLKHLVELKSQAGAQVQQQAQAALPKPAEVKKPEPAPTVKPVAEPVSAPPPAVAVKPVEAAAPVAEKPAEAPPEAKPAEPPPVAVAPPQPAAKKPAAPPPPPPPEPSFIEENPELVFGGGGLLALLLGYLGFSAYRRKKQAREEIAQHDEPGVAGALAARPGAVAGAASESVDSGEVSIQGDFSEGGVLTTAESVDPVAEAEVYMAYGRDSQAEEILQEGLKTDPTRTAIHLKLLELYANRKSVPRFEFVANELHGLNGGKGPDWDRAVALAAGLGLTGGLFAVVAVASPAVFAPAEAALAAEAQPPAEEEVGSFDFDLDLGTASGVSGVSGLAVAAEPAGQQPAAEAAGLDFDFDLGSPTQNPPPVAMAETAAVEGNVVDFSLDIGSSTEAPAVEPAVAAGNEIEFDLDLGSAQVTPVAVEIAEPVAKSGAGELDFDFDLELGAEEPTPVGVETEPRATATGAEPLVALDLAGINFDLGETGSKAEQGAPAEEATEMAEEAAPAVEQDAASKEVAAETDDSEVATKLELALAYEEMGDREGARELLNEVLNEGSPAQQGQARARLDQLDL
ncbi:MAG: FimV/HubP family polar landmark protein [Rhodocyclaceae bacterium]|nr:FimV/HubP family polar landmark protein [Rhodocyclaceae bacterium]